jgi:hypothetical protein
VTSTGDAPGGPSGLTKLLVDEGEGSFAGRARRRRARWLLERFPDLAEMRVLDLGGEVRTWQEFPVRPAEVVLLNIPAQVEKEQAALDRAGDPAGLRVVPGDGCDPSAELRQEAFDLVFSNSVIEHVGGYERRQAFARTARELAPHHWVQTPNRYFPLEPHWLFPGFQFLPPRARAAVSRVWPAGNYARDRRPLEKRLNTILWVELLSPAEMRLLFPDSQLLRERAGGLTKSLIAVG